MAKKKGFLLIFAYMVIAVLSVLLAALVARSIAEWRVAERDKNSTAAFYAAEAGIDYGLDWLRSQGNPPGGTAPFNLPAGPAIETGAYSVTIDPDNANPTAYLKRYQIISTGQSGDTTRVATYEVKEDTFARFAYLSDTEHFLRFIPVWFITGDQLSGPVHTNSHFHISGNPVFTDVVSSVDDAISYMHGGPPNDNPSFQKGIKFGAPEIEMPSKALDLRTAAVQDGLHLTGPTTIVLNADGTMNVTNSHENWVNQNMPLPANGALFVTGAQGGDNLWISGTLNGQLTVGTNRDLVITNNITYNTNPVTNPSSTDMLGLIAEKDVIISQNAPSNLTIQASILALDDSFYVENWAGLPPKGKLNIYGGLIQDARGPIGLFNPATSTIISGYSKNYVYDPRLRNIPPPFFPTTGDYVGLSWREQ
ncbi:MAG: hypothetical protein Q8R05_08505 [Candidatus Omnitrophota bacterium]|nr:hypothetical protein [Candidatus Omnitrophota bacterium]